jgi:hypothetical protein
MRASFLLLTILWASVSAQRLLEIHLMTSDTSGGPTSTDVTFDLTNEDLDICQAPNVASHHKGTNFVHGEIDVFHGADQLGANLNGGCYG